MWVIVFVVLLSVSASLVVAASLAMSSRKDREIEMCLRMSKNGKS